MKEFDNLKETIDKLRSPEGCPWDKKQTHNSLLPYLLEEAYEVSDAIIDNNKNNLKEELGDLLLQIMLHSKIAEEENIFGIEDVLIFLNEKLIRRHPHVFKDENADTADEVIKLWENIKLDEKKDKKNCSIFDNIPKELPPLSKSYKLQKVASSVGFDWNNINDVIAKIEEEIGELKEAIASNDNIEHEFGDLLFSLVNIGRFLHLHSDIALLKANERFMKRFKYIEDKINVLNKSFKDFTLDELEKFWQEAKTSK